MPTKKSKSDTLNLSNSGIIMGSRVDTFTLTPLNFYIKDKGDLAAMHPLFWDRMFIDFDSRSKLYIHIEKNLKGNKVQLSLLLNSFYPGNNPPKPIGLIDVNFNDFDFPKKNTGKIPVPLQSTPGFTEYYVQSSDVCNRDGTAVELTFTDFVDLMLVQVKVEIFTPRALAFLPRNK
ncbi:MAG TPA: hypothetical protein PK736_04445 [Bacteroidia bacterium]|nr:hypothetical protein [Bacteroidia bacterium]